MTYVCIALIAYIALRELLAARERRQLLMHVQAPERAIAQQAPRPKRKTPAPIPADDDARYQQLIEERGDGDS